MPDTASHTWSFSRAGGFDQPNVDHAKDFEALGGLDLKLWAALACPTKGLELDERTLTLIDTDGDGRIRAPEVIAAVHWAQSHLKDMGALEKGGSTIAVADVGDDSDAGRVIAAAAKRISQELGKADATTVSLEDVARTAAVMAQAPLNGDGIVPPDAADDEAVRQALGDIVGCTGGVVDRSGKPGVDRAQLDAFMAQAAAYLAWSDRATAEGDALLPAGTATAAAAAAIAAVGVKVDDFFSRCRLAAFDARALPALNRQEEEYLAIAAQDLSASAKELEAFPVARIEAHRALPLVDGLNPAWAQAIATLRSAAVVPLLGEDKDSLADVEWAALQARISPYAAWQAAKPVNCVEGLGVERLRQLVSGDTGEAIASRIAADAALASEYDGVAAVERLIRYQRDLRQLVCNFVNFLDFYHSADGGVKAVFQVGTLYLDGRACDLVVRVRDAARHALLAAQSKAYLAYCTCTRPSAEKMEVVAVFSDGDADALGVGRNGVFYDRQGRDWDATITKVVVNPIGLREAFWAPYKRVVSMLEELAAKRAAAADKEVEGATKAAAEVDVGKTDEPKKIDVGTVAALGVAVGAIGAFLTALLGYVTNMFDLHFWVICTILAGLVVLISTPSMLIAWLKLRQRNLAPILDANGWAVNGSVKLSTRFGRKLTHVARLPKGARRGSGDPNEDRPSPWLKVVVAVVAIAFCYSLLNDYGFIRELTGGRFGDDPAVTEVSGEAM